MVKKGLGKMGKDENEKIVDKEIMMMKIEGLERIGKRIGYGEGN